MGTNSFFSFATGPGANVATDAGIVASGALPQGLSSGEVTSPIFNKLHRNSSVIAALIGQFISDYAQVDANDGQALSVLEANFLTALGAAATASPSLLRTIQVQPGNYAVDTGDLGANKIHIALPAYTPATLANGTPIRIQKSAGAGPNTGAMTAQIDVTTGSGQAAQTASQQLNVVWADGSALAKGDWPAGGSAQGVVIGGVLLLTGFTGPSVFARKSDIALSSLSAGFRSLSSGASAGTKTATWSLEQAAAAVSAGGQSYPGYNLALSFNGANTGAGGMDAGAMPAQADLSIYAIYNPTTQTWAALGCAGSTSRGTLYTGSNMPAGYTASVLIWSGVTDASGNFPAFTQRDRTVWLANVAFNTGLNSTSWASVGALSGYIPYNARTWLPEGLCSSTGATTNLWYSPIATEGPGRVTVWSSQNQNMLSAVECPFIIPQTAYYRVSQSQTWTGIIRGYTF